MAKNRMTPYTRFVLSFLIAFFVGVGIVALFSSQHDISQGLTIGLTIIVFFTAVLAGMILVYISSTPEEKTKARAGLRSPQAPAIAVGTIGLVSISFISSQLYWPAWLSLGLMTTVLLVAVFLFRFLKKRRKEEGYTEENVLEKQEPSDQD